MRSKAQPAASATLLPAAVLSFVRYKSAVWFHTDEQKSTAESRLKDYGVDHLVDVDEAKSWHDAEDYHQKYYKKSSCAVQ